MPTHPDKFQITAADASAAQDDRFHRFGLIQWWDQKKLSQAKILVVGAGALGNEIVKNLALLGVGHILIADMDCIENSNLSRSILFRACDNGRSKAEVAARSAAQIYPDIKAAFVHANVVYDLGLGVFRWADLVLGGLDNREARLAINRNCWKLNRPWIDGAIEQIQGTARVFIPDGPAQEAPCYECTMTAADWKLLQNRRSCNLLSRPEMEGGKTPTTPTISSIIAGVQCQEALKLLHGLPSPGGRGWVFDGMSTDAYQVNYQRNPNCYSHDPLENVISLDAGASSITLGELLEQARQTLGPQATLELGRDVLQKLVCPQCRREEELFISLGKAAAELANCPHCPSVRREVVTFHSLRGDEAFLSRTPAQIGLPPLDILIAWTPERAVGLELAGDAKAVLGPLIEDQSALEWI